MLELTYVIIKLNKDTNFKCSHSFVKEQKLYYTGSV